MVLWRWVSGWRNITAAALWRRSAAATSSGVPKSAPPTSRSGVTTPWLVQASSPGFDWSSRATRGAVVRGPHLSVPSYKALDPVHRHGSSGPGAELRAPRRNHRNGTGSGHVETLRRSLNNRGGRWHAAGLTSITLDDDGREFDVVRATCEPAGAPASNRLSSSAVVGHIASQLRRRRVDRGLSQAGLADLLGVSCQQVHKYESGRRPRLRPTLAGRPGARRQCRRFLPGSGRSAEDARPRERRRSLPRSRAALPSHQERARPGCGRAHRPAPRGRAVMSVGWIYATFFALLAAGVVPLVVALLCGGRHPDRR